MADSHCRNSSNYDDTVILTLGTINIKLAKSNH